MSASRRKAWFTGVLCAVLPSCVGTDAPGGGGGHRPASTVPRLAAAAVAAPDVGFVRDFDVLGDTLFLLDRFARVIVLERAGRAWTRVREFGRAGAGPGEFHNVSGLAVTAGGDLVVAEAARLQYLRSDGVVLSVHRLTLPCAMALPRVAAADGGVFVHGNCYRAGIATDTMVAVLTWSTDTVGYRIIAQELRFTRDGRAGTVFAAERALSPGADGTHLFGTGVSNCIWRVAEVPGAAPTVAPQCPAAATLYSAAPPPELEARLRAGSPGGVQLSWPTPLPAYLDRLDVGGRVVLLRSFTADSVVLQLAAPEGTDIGVMPLEGLVGCKAVGCLWILEDQPARPRLLLLDTIRVNQLLRVDSAMAS